MDEILLWILERHGVAGIIVGFLLWDKIGKPWWKKNVKDDWISWKDVKANRKDIEAMKEILNGHLEKEAQEDILIGKMQIKLGEQEKRLDGEIDDLKDRDEHIFKQNESIFNKLDVMWHDIQQLGTMKNDIQWIKDMIKKNGH